MISLSLVRICDEADEPFNQLFKKYFVMCSREMALFSMVRHLLIILDSFIVSAIKEMNNGNIYAVSDCLGMIYKMQTYYLMLWGFPSLPPSFL